MDLHSMLNENDGPAPEKRPNPPAPSPGGMGHSTHSTPLYAPSSGPGSIPPQSRGLTPVRTTSQPPVGGYPFPSPSQQQQQQQQPQFQSSAPAHPNQQYPPQTPYTATTPGPRAPSHGYQQSYPSPSRFQPSGIPQGLQHAHHTQSLSPTPPSNPSPNAPPVRQSPLTGLPGQSMQYQQPPLQQYQHSQPSTPLGPSLHQYQRSSGQSYHDIQSPYHSRTMSGASNGIASGSPAQHHPNIGNLVDSPSTHPGQPTHMRRTSEYLNQLERERSVSVSPKTKVPPRLGSRQSSLHESHSARSSVQPSGISPAESYSHMQGVAHAQNPTTHVAPQPPPVTPHSLHSSNPLAAIPGPQADHSLSHANNQPMIHHQPQRMGMNHLLTPATDHSPPINGATMAGQQPVQKGSPSASSMFIKPSSKTPKKPTLAASPPSQSNEIQSGASVLPQSTNPEQRNNSVDRRNEMDSLAATITKPSLKRATESDHSAEPPSKRGRMRKYTERPLWARLARNNPRLNELQQGETKTQASHQPHRQQSSLSAGPPAAVSRQMAPNGQKHHNGGVPSTEPWLQNPPLDQDLIHTRDVLGKWEKTARWNTPYPDLLKAVQDWLFSELSALGEIGSDPQDGTIEIEAKIGHIMKKGSDERLQMPILNAAVLAPQTNDQIRFESQLDEGAFKAMNAYLNTTCQESMKPGRVRMEYAHPKETDSFRSLSTTGLQALPQAFQRRQRGRELKLRTTTVDKSGEIKARIVKIGVSDLHIFNPTGEYDCRISINLEMNMMRPDLHPIDITVEPTGDKPAPPDRQKDRLSYKHLEYSFDLTQVKVPGMQPKYELELEVNAATLRNQMKLMLSGSPDAFGDVVSGFVDNATFLMRQKPNAS